MLKKMLVVVILISLLTACGASFEEAPVNPEGCSYDYSVTFDGANVDPFELKITSHASWVQSEEQPELYELVGDNNEEWNNLVSRHNEVVAKLNAGLSLLFVEDEFLEGAKYSAMDEIPPVLDRSFDRECPNPEYYGYSDNHWSHGLPFEEMSDSGYITTTRIGETTTFVEVTSAKNSVVNYSFPTTYLQSIYDYAFGRSDNALELNPQYVEIPDPDMPDGLTYSQAMISQMMNADSAGREALSFTLNVEDFEGRAQLKPVIAKGIELAAAQAGNPVLATVHAMMSNGQREVAYAEMDGAFGFFLFAGSGFINGEAQSKAWFEDVVKASIYITPVQP